MYFPRLNMNDQEIRVALTNLEKLTDNEENRFGEIRETIGNIQSEHVYPSIVGFERAVLYILLKLIKPILFAAILVFVDTVWIAVSSLLILFLGYFALQFYFVKVNMSRRELLNFGSYMLVGYISVFLFIQENHVERNYFGWIYIVILTVQISFVSVEQLRKAVKTLKFIFIKVE